jgi:FkbM family methyltransferase
VTKAFYERGWRGINVEPAPQWFERLEKARHRDINLQLALGAEPGEITLYEIPDTGLSTAEKKIAERHEAEHGYQSRELRVKMDTLSSVCEKFHLAPIHFLKVDVEGTEKAVLQGSDFGKIRPWIILVEATLPNSQEESYSDWEPLLLNARYEYAYFDGLNRYYVAAEHENLKAAFKVPPNVFDDFVRSGHLESVHRAQEAEAKVKEVEQQASQAEARAEEAETKARQVEARAEEAETKARQAEARAEETETKARQAEERAALAAAKAKQVEVKVRQAEASARQAQQRAGRADARAEEAETKAQQAETTLQAVFSSRSWRVTEPLRRLANIVRPPREKANAKGLIGASFDETSNESAHAPSMTAPAELMELSPRAREICSQLNAAIEKNQENG